MIQTIAVLTLMLICAIQSLISAGNYLRCHVKKWSIFQNPFTYTFYGKNWIKKHREVLFYKAYIVLAFDSNKYLQRYSNLCIRKKVSLAIKFINLLP